MAKVYVINKSYHDFEAAKKFGNLIFCTKGRMNRFSTNDMLRKFSDAMRNSNKEDYLLLCSLNVMNAIACAIFARKHGTLNLLLYKEGEYIERNHVLENEVSESSKADINYFNSLGRVTMISERTLGKGRNEDNECESKETTE